MKKIILIAGIFLMILIVSCGNEKVENSDSDDGKIDSNDIKSFEECVDAGGNIAESYPRRCFIGGYSFVEEITRISEGNYKENCENIDGTWIEEAKECEGISKEDCEMIGGTFNECASACRNNPEADICTMQCVMVCQFEKEKEETHECTEAEIKNKLCTKEYMPVCGDDGIEYSNGCMACSSGNIRYYTEGTC